MLIVDGVLVSDELIDNNFCCELSYCCGCCCIEGDVGAPLHPLEIADLEDNYPIFKKYMTEEGQSLIEANGVFTCDKDGDFVTPLLSDEACAYVYFDNGIAKCAIEKAFHNHEIEFPKPISCHLYPIRIKKLPDYDALNYHHWIVCQEAVREGNRLKLPVYRFLKDALIRKYGESWYHDLEVAISHRNDL